MKEELCCIPDTRGLYRFQSAWKTLSCNMLKLLRTSVSSGHYDSLPLCYLLWLSHFGTPVSRCQRYLSAVAKNVEEFRCYTGGGKSKVCLPCKVGKLVGKGMANVRCSGIEGLDTSREYMAGPRASSFRDYFNYQPSV